MNTWVSPKAMQQTGTSTPTTRSARAVGSGSGLLRSRRRGQKSQSGTA